MRSSIRRFRAPADQIDEALHIVDTGFADDLAAIDGFVAYQCLVLDDGTIMSITTCESQEGCDRSVEVSAEMIRTKMGHLDVERVDAMSGSLEVSRAQERVLEAAHH